MLRMACTAAVLAGLLIAAPAGAQNVVRKGDNLVEVTVDGQGMDRKEAISDALRNAVERGAGTVIHSESKTKDFVLARDTVLARSTGFVQSHEVLAARELVDGTWQAKVRAVVSVKGVEDAWGAVTTLLEQMGRPKVMVFINERIDGNRVDNSTVQTRIENLLLESGFKLVVKDQLKAIDQKDLAAAVAEDSPARIQAIAKRFGAQLFISGTANATSGGQRTIGGVNFSAYEAEANVRCYRSDTAQLLSSVPGEPVRGVDRVWRSAAKKALDGEAQLIAPRIRNDVLRFWQDAMSGRGEIQLHVEGVTFRQYADLKKALEALDEVSDVTTKYHNKVAECSLQSKVNAETLALKLLDAVESLEITDVSQNVIKAKFVE